MSVNIKKNGTLTKLAGLYANINLRLSQLLDTDISSLEDGQILAYNNETSKWENQDAPAGVEVVDNLTTQSATSALSANQGYVLNNALAEKANTADVLPTLITSPVNKQILSYDSSSGKWINTANGNTVLLGTADPAANLGKEGDLYVKLSSPSYGSSYRIHTKSTGGETASIDVDTITDGTVVATQNINYHWPVQTFPDFSTNYKSSNWTITITSDNVYGREKGSTISWPYYQTNDVTLTINPPSVYGIFVKSRGIWIQIGKSPVENFAELKDTNFNNLQDGQLAVYNSTTGKWENQTPNFSDKFIITRTWDEELEKYIIDKTPSETLAAHEAGKTIILKDFSYEVYEYFYLLADFYIYDDMWGCNFVSTEFLDDDNQKIITVRQVRLVVEGEDDTWSVEEENNGTEVLLKGLIYLENHEFKCSFSPSQLSHALIDEYYSNIFLKYGVDNTVYTLTSANVLNRVYKFSTIINDGSSFKLRTFTLTATQDSVSPVWQSIVMNEVVIPTSGEDKFVISVTPAGEDPETGKDIFSADKTPAEAASAINSGKDIVGKLETGEGGTFCLPLITSFLDPTSNIINLIFATSFFAGYEEDDGELLAYSIQLHSQSIQDDDWESIEVMTGEIEETPIVKFSVDEDEGVYSLDQNFQEFLTAYNTYRNIFLTYNNQQYAYEKYDSSTHTFYFTSTLADSIKTLVLVGNSSTGEWTSITLTESSGGDPNAIRWEEAKTSVKKNWLPNNAVSQTINGLTFTVNADRSVTVNGTATADAMFNLCPTQGFENDIGRGDNKSTLYLASGSYLFTNATSTSITSGVRLILNNVNGVAQWVDADNTTVRTITAPEHPITVGINVASGTVVSNLTLYPMIRLSSIEDDSYAPYIPDNTELDEKIPIKIEGKTYTAENVTALVKAVMDELTASGDFSNRSFLGGVVWSGQDYHQIEGYAHSRYVKGILSRGDAMFLFSYDKNSGTAGVSTINPSSYYALKSGDTFTGRVSFQASDNTVKINLRPENSDYYSTIQHQTGGNEATVFATKKDVTSYIFANGEDAIGNNGNGTRWDNIVPGLQIKKNKVAMGKLIADGIDPTYQLDVGGTLNVDGNVYKNGIQVDLETHLDQTATTSTTTDTVYTFTDSRITSSSAIDVYADIFGVNPSNIQVVDGSCTVTFPKQATAQSMTCRIYIK